MKAPTRQRRRLPIARPATRADCARTGRPCPWVGCRYHLAVDVSVAGGLALTGRVEDAVSRVGARSVLRGHARPEHVEAFVERAVARLAGMSETCALDVADRAGHPADDHAIDPHLSRACVGELLGVGQERIRQLELTALARLRRRGLHLHEER